VKNILNILLLISIAISTSFASWNIGYEGSGFADGSGYQMQQDGVLWNHTDGDKNGQSLNARWSGYRLQDEFDGILAFRGNALFFEGGAWYLWGTHWFLASISDNATTDVTGLGGSLTWAKSFSRSGGSEWKPYVLLKREPFSEYPLPLSLKTMRNVAETGLKYKDTEGTLTSSISVEKWLSPRSEIRTLNDTLLEPTEPWILQAIAYWLPITKPGLAWGWSCAFSHADRTTQEPTTTETEYKYSWYPAAAPIWSGAVSLIAQAGLWQSSRAEWAMMMSVPLLSGEFREWDNEQIKDWGTAPFKFSTSWVFHSADWQLGTDFSAELTPWKHMQFWNEDAYKVFKAKVNIQRNF